MQVVLAAKVDVVQGAVPQWLDGMYVRNGPGRVTQPKNSMIHWFDGAPKLHTWSFSNGTVGFAGQFLPQSGSMTP